MSDDSLVDLLATALPAELRAVAPALAGLLATLAAGPPAAQALAADPLVAPALRALAGHTLPSPAGPISFGSDNQLGEVTIGDVAAGHLVKLSIPVARHEASQTISASQGGTISQVVQIAGSGNTLIFGGGNANPAAASTAPAEPLLRAGATVFLADGGTASPALDALALALRLRGLRVWRGPELGELTSAAYTPALAQIDAAVIALTPTSCDSDQLLHAELPAIWERYSQPAPFRVIPLVDGASERAVERAIRPSGRRVAELRAFALDAAPGRRAAQINALALAILRAVVLPHLRRAVAAEGAVELRLFSHPASGDTGRADLLLDWVECFGTRAAPIWPDPGLWADWLIPALADVRQVVGLSATPRLRVDGRFHLSAGYALGHQFAATTGMRLEVRAPSGAWWGDASQGESGAELVAEELPQHNGSEVSLEISLSQDARDDVSSTLEVHPLPLAQRIQLTSRPVLDKDVEAARQFVRSSAHAVALARQIANAILLQKRAPRIHLFGPLPQALAVLVGARLNTARPIQCYEYVRNAPSDEAPYVAACLLA